MDWITEALKLGPAAVALAGVAITLFFTNQREKRQLKQQRDLVGLQARRDAYAQYVRAARMMARHIRQRMYYYEHALGRPKDETAKAIFAQGDGLIADLAAAHAAAWLQATPGARMAIQRLYDALNAFEAIAGDAEAAHRYDSAFAAEAHEEILAAEAVCMDACAADISVDQLGRRAWFLGSGRRRELPPAP